MAQTTLPSAHIFQTDSGEPSLRWGIVGPGWIAEEFVTALRAHTVQIPVIVGSRSADRAEEFAKRHGIERAVGSYAEVFEDPGVDVVYVATPQSEHLALGLQAIAAGKHVLIEKPLALNAEQGRVLAAAAAAAGVLLMEAMWSRYLPQSAVIRALLAEGAFGEVRAVFADHGQAIPFDAEHRLYRPELGGGALGDLGIYPVQFDSMVLGAPTTVTAVGGRASTGVDAYATLVLGHGRDTQSTLTTTILAATPTTASIVGTQARLDVAAAFFTPTSMVLSGSSLDAPLSWRDTSGRPGMAGLSWQATALAGYVAQGRTESPLHTLEETISILATLDFALAQIPEG